MSRVARAGLTPARVIEEAELLVDEGDLTLAALGARLGVRVPSLYKHIDGLDALLGALRTRATLDLTTAMRNAAVGVSRDEAVVALARAYRTWAGAHPGRYLLAQQPAEATDAEGVAASESAVQVVADVLAGYGLSETDTIDAIRALRSSIHGFVALEASGGFGMPRDVDRSFDALITALTRGFART